MDDHGAATLPPAIKDSDPLIGGAPREVRAADATIAAPFNRL